jgi:hypothetical protein
MFAASASEPAPAGIAIPTTAVALLAVGLIVVVAFGVGGIVRGRR